jgi:uncharacterized protein
VVDAAGRGWELCVRALATAGPPPPPAAPGASAPPEPAGAARATGPPLAAPGAASTGYEVQYLVACTGRDARTLGERLRALGDSVTLAGGDGAYRVHVHTDRPGPAIEAALGLGELSRIEVACLHRPPGLP